MDAETRALIDAHKAKQGAAKQETTARISGMISETSAGVESGAISKDVLTEILAHAAARGATYEQGSFIFSSSVNLDNFSSNITHTADREVVYGGLSERAQVAIGVLAGASREEITSAILEGGKLGVFPASVDLKAGIEKAFEMADAIKDSGDKTLAFQIFSGEANARATEAQAIAAREAEAQAQAQHAALELCENAKREALSAVSEMRKTMGESYMTEDRMLVQANSGHGLSDSCRVTKEDIKGITI